MKVLVTGGAGFIGSNIVDELIKVGYEVVVVDNLITGQKRYINNHVAFYQLDIIDKRLEEIFEQERPDYVIHHAAQIDVQLSIKDPVLDGNVNILGTVNLLQNCIKYEVKKVIYASSAAVYGNPQYLGIDEEHPIEPISFYGLSKYVPEEYLRVYSQLYGLEFSVLRYANVYGIRQDPKGEGGVVSIFLNRYLRNLSPIIFGDGTQTRDFIYVKDIVTANLLALRNGRNEVFNIGCNTQLSILDLIGIMNEITGRAVQPQFESARKGDILHCYLDNSRARKSLGWQPKYDLYKGLKETIEYYQK